METSRVEDPSEKFASTSSESDYSSAVAFESPLPENLEIKVQQLTKLLNSSALTNCLNSNDELVNGEEAKVSSSNSTPNIQASENHVCDDIQLPNNEDCASQSTTTTNQTSSKQGESNKVRSKENVKTKHKEDRNMDHVLKALQSLKTPEERLAALCKKYTELIEEHRNLRLSYKMRERYNSQLVKEKEQLQIDYSKGILARSRLESLCRELQRQCKVVKEESLLRVKEEEEKRKDVSAKFQTTLTEISTLMQDNNQKNSVLREENLKLSQKLKTLVEQYEAREHHIGKVLDHKNLEHQLSEARLAKANMSLAEDKEKHLKEKRKLLEELSDFQKRCNDLTTSEAQLRAQVAMYTEKYSEFQDTLTKSNQVFTSFKGEMEKMSKKIKKLESETGTWKTRWENSNKAMMEMAKEKQKHDTEIVHMQKKVGQLEKLCRALQLERNTLQQQLNAQNTLEKAEENKSEVPVDNQDEKSEEIGTSKENEKSGEEEANVKIEENEGPPLIAQTICG